MDSSPSTHCPSYVAMVLLQLPPSCQVTVTGGELEVVGSFLGSFLRRCPSPWRHRTRHHSSPRQCSPPFLSSLLLLPRPLLLLLLLRPLTSVLAQVLVLELHLLVPPFRWCPHLKRHLTHLGRHLRRLRHLAHLSAHLR